MPGSQKEAAAVAEEEAVEQFHVYQKLGLMDDTTDAMMKRILKDEAFHVSYSRAELDRYEEQGHGEHHEADEHDGDGHECRGGFGSRSERWGSSHGYFVMVLVYSRVPYWS